MARGPHQLHDEKSDVALGAYGATEFAGAPPIVNNGECSVLRKKFGAGRGLLLLFGARGMIFGGGRGGGS